MRMELILENNDLTLPAGLTGTVVFNVSPAEGTFLVPANALIIRQGKQMVATNLGRDVEVISSRLSEASSVILNPSAMLREGDAVTAAPLTAVK